MSICAVLFTRLLTLAQEPPVADPPAANPLMQFLVVMLPAVVIMLLLQSFLLPNPSRDKKKRDDMIAGLNKNDPVVTIGGILGTFVSASEDRSEVTIKVDDNTRLRIQASAVREVLAKKPDVPAKTA